MQPILNRQRNGADSIKHCWCVFYPCCLSVADSDSQEAVPSLVQSLSGLQIIRRYFSSIHWSMKESVGVALEKEYNRESSERIQGMTTGTLRKIKEVLRQILYDQCQWELYKRSPSEWKKSWQETVVSEGKPATTTEAAPSEPTPPPEKKRKHEIENPDEEKANEKRKEKKKKHKREEE